MKTAPRISMRCLLTLVVAAVFSTVVGLRAQDSSWQDSKVNIDVEMGDVKVLINELSKAAKASGADKKGFKGIQLILGRQGSAQRRMSLQLTKAPLSLAVKYVADGFGFDYQCHDGMIVVFDKESSTWVFELSDGVKKGIGMKPEAVPDVDAICKHFTALGIGGLNNETVHYANGYVRVDLYSRYDMNFLRALITVFERGYTVSSTDP